MFAFCIRADEASRSPVCRLREKFGKNVAETCTRIRCSFRKDVAGNQVVETQPIFLVRLEQLPSLFQVAVAGPQHVQAGTHQVEGRAVGRHIEQANPEVGIAAVAGKINLGVDRASHFRIAFHRRRVKGQNIRIGSPIHDSRVRPRRHKHSQPVWLDQK